MRALAGRVTIWPGRQPASDLLKLPADDRAQIAIALWESLTDTQRDAVFDLTDEQRAELDRRWAEHVRNPAAAIPWSEAASCWVRGDSRRQDPARWQTRT